MSSVSPPDGGYNYYSRPLSDLEEELRNDSKRSRENEQSRTEELEKAQKEALRHQEEQMKDTVNDIRKKSSEAVDRERVRGNTEVKRLKAETYDKWGKYNGEDADTVKAKLRTAESAYEDSLSKERETSARAASHYQKLLRENNENMQDESEKSVAAAVEAGQNQIDTINARQRSEDQKAMDKGKESYKTLAQKNIDDRNEERMFFDRAAKEAERDYEHRTRNSEKSYLNRVHAKEEQMEAERVQVAEANRNALDAETRGFRKQLRDLSDYAKQKEKDTAEATIHAFQTHENEFNYGEHAVQYAHDAEKRKLEHEIEEVDAHQNATRVAALHDQDLRFKKAVQFQDRENETKLKHLENSYAQDVAKLKDRTEQTVSYQEAQHENRVKDLNEGMAKVHQKQAENFQHERDDVEVKNQSEINRLQDRIKEQAGYKDLTQISPIAEEALRRSVADQYQKTLDAHMERTDRRLASVTDNAKANYHDLSETSRIKEDSIRSKAQYESDSDRAHYTQLVSDTQFEKQQALRNREQSFERQADSMTKNSARSLEGQRRDYEELIDTMRYDTAQKLQGLQNESDFKIKMAHREYATKYNELNRDMHKQLTDQKDEYEALIYNLKFDHNKAIKDLEKQGKILTEEQSRGYEQHVAQLEAQHKERERTIAQNYEDEIDKLRHANALLVQKKG